MEVSTLRYSRGIGLHGRSPLLRLQSDERLIAYVRRGNNAAFEVLVARYQSRLLSFCRHLLGSREDAEDVLQEVMAAAFNAILADDRPINVRPWLYRIARNRSLNHLRRIQAVGVDSMDVHLSDNGATTADKVHEREEFRVLVEDIQDLPETQRTALVLREMDALSYEQIAEAMETTVSSVKSLLVRARVSLAEAAEARLLSCDEVRIELGEVAEGLRRRPSSLVRRHLRSCKRCSSFKVQLRETNKALTALLPIGPMVFVLRKLALVHLGHSAGAGAGTSATGAGAAGQAAAVGGTAAAGAGATATFGSAGGILSAGVGAIATKAAAGLAAAALVTAGAVEVSQRPAHTKVAATQHHAAVVATPTPTPAPVTHSQQSFQSTVVEVHPKKAVKKAVVTKPRDNAQAASKPASKTSDKATTTTTPTATTTTPATTQPPGRQQTQTDPTVLPPSPTPTSSTPTATTAPAPTTTTPAPTTTDPTTPTTTGPTATTPTDPTTTPTTPTTATPLPPTDQPPAAAPPATNGSPTDPIGAASSSSPVVDSFAATPQHRHRHHGALTW
ncbi:MAG TPA: sigma-70 family RNA polymerase sigma factor [Solirubrobacteraceae bacterium]|nr:sigma-70 family RNA polymerase sigma factor [Solirubrobacteraceae bacterium]